MNKTQDEKRDLSQKAFETLLDTRNMYALDALRLFDINYQGIPENWLDENKLRNKISIINSFPKEAVEISRIALKKFDNQRFHQPWNDYQNLFEYGVSIISEYGDLTDISLLKNFQNTYYATTIQAIKSLEEKTYSSRRSF